MLSNTALKHSAACTTQEHWSDATGEFDFAKSLIGRRITLRQALMDHASGTRCLVMCVVDFGDGPLVWVTTDDALVDDVDQFTVAELGQFFDFEPQAANDARDYDERTEAVSELHQSRSAGFKLKEAIYGWVSSLRNAIDAHHYALENTGMGEGQQNGASGHNEFKAQILAIVDRK